MTTVGLIGDGVGIKAVRAALEDTDADAVSIGTDAVGRTDVSVVVGPAGADGFETASRNARASQTPLLCVEIGGIGGHRVGGVDAAVSGAAPETACYECLRQRVAAAEPTIDDETVPDSTVRLAGALAGRELALLVGGGESSILGGVIELPYATRQILPVPYCECAGEDTTPGSLERTHETRSLDASISLAETAFDERVGPITSVGEVESFPIPYYLTTLAETPFSDGDVPDHAAGVGIDWDPAYMKALGEGLERYSAAVYRTNRFDTDPDAPVDPERFVSPDGYSDASVGYWHDAENLETGQQVQVPAELAVFPPPERTVRPAITTGLGLGNGGNEAIRSGLYEVIERDAAMLAWYSTYEPIGLSTDDDRVEALTARAESEGLTTTLLLLTADIDVPVVAACVHREGEWPRFAAGTDADLDPTAAVCGALTEAIQNWLELRRMGPDRAMESGGAIGTHADFPDSTRAFANPETTVPAETVGPSDLPDEREELDALLDRVSSVVPDVYAARLTPRDVDAIGFEAVRVLVPEAQPLFVGDAYFGERARTVPRSLGFDPRLDRTYHPFP